MYTVQTMPVGLGILAGTGEKGWIVNRYGVHSIDHASGIRHTGWYRGEGLNSQQVHCTDYMTILTNDSRQRKELTKDSRMGKTDQ